MKKEIWKEVEKITGSNEKYCCTVYKIYTIQKQNTNKSLL